MGSKMRGGSSGGTCARYVWGRWFFRIDEMSKSGELEMWLLDRFGATDFPRIDKMLKSGEFGGGREASYYDNQHNEPAASSDYKTFPDA